VSSGPRIAPLPKDEWADDAIAALKAAYGAKAAERILSDAPDAPPLPNVLATMMRNPALTGPFLTYNASMMRAPLLGKRNYELMVLRVAWRTRSTYEWVQHVRMAQRCGITIEEVEAVGRGSDDERWTPLEADLIAATDQLIDRYCLDDDTWARLADQLDERQLMEVAFIVGTYTCLAMVFNTFGIEVDSGLDGLPAPPLPDDR
jgi:4-carboxymuconolactone decarboxylase